MAAAVLMQRGLPPVFGQLALLLSELSFKFAAAFCRPGNHVCELESTVPRVGGARQRMVLHLLPFVQVPGLRVGQVWYV